ncbi:hypothetical protein F4778DRAFT_488684 [Xylariomycetidae sp. FL2044]|nr:hypothetical protein F4778DRAFT_488684 [Xylariomycetidae sp. FL2044]
MDDTHRERLQDELELLKAMYPDTVTFSPKARELKYVQTNETSGTLVLRLPDDYPVKGSPEVISAKGPEKEDLRSATQETFAELGTSEGDEVLDALLLAFQGLLSSRGALRNQGINPVGSSGSHESAANQTKTVIIWLHHLLNTNKRKLALNPSTPGSEISGITKPGYPGVLIYSGAKHVVDLHVADLRSQRWQAFQVRFDSEDYAEEDGMWDFGHGAGIREVESMSEVTQGVHPRHRETLLNAIGVK